MDTEKDLDKRLVAEALEALKSLEEPEDSVSSENLATAHSESEEQATLETKELAASETEGREMSETEGREMAETEGLTALETDGREASENESHTQDIRMPKMKLEGVDFLEVSNLSVEDLASAASEAFSELNDGSEPILSSAEMSDEELYMTENLNLVEPIEDEIPQEFIEHSQLISIIESLLFATDKPLSVSTIHNAFKNTNIKPQHVRRALDELQSVYADSYRGVSLEEVHGGYQLRTKLDNTEFLKRMSKVRPFKLSGPALETMAILAYKQPITKSEIDSIRGVESGHLVRVLMERGLVQFAGKSELPGRPMYYGTTRKFLDIFGLRNLNELPTLAEIDELIPEGIGGEEEKRETLGDLSDRMAEEAKSTYSEGEEELTKITDHLNAISTSSDFFEQEKQRQKEKRDSDRANDIREALTVGEAVEEKDIKWLSRYERDLEEKAKALEMARLAEQMTAQMTESRAGSDESLAAALNELSQSQMGVSVGASSDAVEAAINSWDAESELEVVRLESTSEDNDIEEISLMNDSSSQETAENEATEDELDSFLGYHEEESHS